MMGDKDESLQQLGLKLIELEVQRDRLHVLRASDPQRISTALIESLDRVIARGYALLPPAWTPGVRT